MLSTAVVDDVHGFNFKAVISQRQLNKDLQPTCTPDMMPVDSPRIACALLNGAKMLPQRVHTSMTW
jgi:hypothetical protein